MATIIYPSPIFGPVHSRRLGVSLGINLLPDDGKRCTFDCIYCECGFNADFPSHKPFPKKKEVFEALEKTLRERKENNLPLDDITFAGNGEPTMNPEFPEIVDGIIAIRDKYYPNVKLSILSNSTFIVREDIRLALMKIDNNILKLDTIDPDYIRKVDRPVGKYDVQTIIENLKKFKGHVIIQTMFMKGKNMRGEDVDNTSDKFVLPWLETVKAIGPQKVTVYTIDRETPDPFLEKATHAELDRIVNLLIREGIPAKASY